jgi:hypothetical protein
MKPKQLPSLDELKARRHDILALSSQVKTVYVRNVLNLKLKSVHRDLFTITKNPIYK